MKKRMWSVVCAGAVCATACLPVTNTYQTARVLEPGGFEVTAGVAGARSTDFDNDYSETQVTAQLNAGLTDAVEGRVMVGVIEGEVAPVALAIKGVLIEDTLAFDVPVGTLLGEDLDPLAYLSVHPGLIAGHRFNAQFEVNASVRVSFFRNVLEDGGDVGPFSATLGLGISSDLDRWALRPEVGVGTLDFGDRAFVSAGVGLTGRFGE
jgi:hypothetical protein